MGRAVDEFPPTKFLLNGSTERPSISILLLSLLLSFITSPLTTSTTKSAPVANEAEFMARAKSDANATG